MRDKVRKHFYFSGDVQMVGFRYQAKYAADDLGPVSYTHLRAHET